MHNLADTLSLTSQIYLYHLITSYQMETVEFSTGHK